MGSPRSRRGAPGEAVTVVGAFLLYGMLFFDRLAPLYLVALIAADLGVPAAGEGTLALLIGLGWAAAMLVVRSTSGMASDRTRILLAALGSGLLSVASATAPGWAAFVALRGLGGLAAASGSPATTALVFAAAPPRRRGLDLGIVQSSTRLIGSILSPIVVTAVAVTAGWRVAMVVSGILLLLAGLLMVAVVPAGRRSPRAGGPAGVTLHPGGGRNLLLCVLSCAVLLAWVTIWSQSSVALLRDWLTIDAAAAGRLVGLFGLGAAGAALLLPIVSDGLGRRLALGIAAALGGSGGLALSIAALLDVVPPRGALVTCLVAAGVAMGGLPLVISIIPAETVASGDVGRALTGPIAGGELVGAAALPALAAVVAAPLGAATVLTAAATAVLGLTAVTALLHPLDTGAGPGEEA